MKNSHVMQNHTVMLNSFQHLLITILGGGVFLYSNTIQLLR
jgi:hypothetical protein